MRIKEIQKIQDRKQRQNPYMYKPHITRDKDGNTFKDILNKLLEETK